MRDKGILLLLLIAVLLYGCSRTDYTNNSSREPTIKVENNNFNVTVDECIKILNDDIEKTKLDLIQKEYEVSKYEGYVIYKSAINDKLIVRFVELNEGNNIGIIQLLLLDSYKNQEKEINIKATDADYSTAVKYYNIICQNMKPGFDTEHFLKVNKKNGGVFEDKVLVFSFDKNVSNTDVNYEEEIQLYQVFSSKDFFNNYENDLWDDDSQFFYQQVLD